MDLARVEEVEIELGVGIPWWAARAFVGEQEGSPMWAVLRESSDHSPYHSRAPLFGVALGWWAHGDFVVAEAM